MSAVAAKEINPILAAYLRSLAERPLLTKAATSGTLGFFQEILAGKLAGAPPEPLAKSERTGVPPIDWLKQNHRAIKLAIYGFFISAPLAHQLTGRLQRAFAGKTTPRDKLLMILVQNLLLAPIQNTVYIASLAVIAGARNSTQIKNAIKANFFRVMKISWSIGPLSMFIAQTFIPSELWVPFFTAISAAAGTFINMQVKKKALAAAKAKKDAEDSASKSEGKKSQ
ncbi:hypothetical protein T439DRAFT_321504 [Meredithblackwellia eburnea MCA 4105]